MIYFVRHIETGLIKIGVTNDIKTRMYPIQREYGPCELLGLVAGFEHEEAELHHKFRHILKLGVLGGKEWFNPCPELLDYIKQHSSMQIPLPIGLRKAIGTIQVKRIKVKQAIRDDRGKSTGEYTFVTAPYLYLRYWEQLPLEDRRLKRKAKFRSVYIGGIEKGKARRFGGYPYRWLAEHFQLVLNKSRDAGRGIRAIDSPLYELERNILSCIDMSQEPPKIDHNKLMALQDELSKIA